VSVHKKNVVENPHLYKRVSTNHEHPHFIEKNSPYQHFHSLRRRREFYIYLYSKGIACPKI
jgi:hypothetical protein